MKEDVAELLDILMGFRKFIAMMLVYIVGIVFRIKGYINGDNLVDLYKYTTVAFFGANSVEYFTGVAKQYLTTNQPAQIVKKVETAIEGSSNDNA